MLKETILSLVGKKYSLYKERIKSLILPTIGIKIREEIPGFIFSKIGGYPIITQSEWPYIYGNPLTFLGQINLNEITDMNCVLPKNGIISFFIYTEDIGYRYPEKKNEFKVIYTPNTKEITLEGLKISGNEILIERRITFFEYYTLPIHMSNVFSKEKITDEESEILDDLDSDILFLINQDFETEHQLLGYPRALQGSVNFWWAVKYLGIEKQSYSDEELKLLYDEEDNFVLLLQVNFGDQKIEIDRFGDCVAYFGIHKDDLRKQKFENAILVMQNI